MTLKNIFPLLILLIPCIVQGQEKTTINLWPGKVPGEIKEKTRPVFDTIARDNVKRIVEITDPAIEIWLPGKKEINCAGIIICPGGAYSRLSWDKEGTEIAQWLNKNGIAAFVLSYRVPNKREGALQDAQRAIRIVRNNAKSWNIDPDKIGIMGFSAGASLSARSATSFTLKTYPSVDDVDSLSCRPEFALLIYPAYLDQGEKRSLTPELKITKETPQVFIFQAADDPYGNSALVMAGALRDSKIPVELHLVPKGGHGYGMRPGNPAAESWPPLAEKWLENVISTNK